MKTPIESHETSELSEHAEHGNSSETEGPEVINAGENVAAAADLNRGSIQEQAAQLLREGRYSEARQVLKKSRQVRREEQRAQWLVEVQVEREKAIELTDAGKLEEAQQALERAAELERKATGGFRQTKQLLNSVQSRLPKWPRKPAAAATPSEEAAPAEEIPADPVAESMRIVGQHAKIAALVGLLPGGLVNFVAILSIQVPMVLRITRAFGQKASREQVRGVLLSFFSAMLPGLVGQGAGMAIGSVTAMATGLVVSIIATPILAYAITRAVGNTFIMHFESGGTLLTFDPKAFTEHFVNEFKKAGGKVREDQSTAAPVHHDEAVTLAQG